MKSSRLPVWKDVKGSRRVSQQSAAGSITTITQGLVELITNVDDEYQRMNNPNKKYAPKKVECSGSGNKHFCGYDGKQASEDCHKEDEHTRLSNPPCTLRGTGWNRWEWLCQNPQDQVFRPYEWNTNTKLVAKDNYRPCVPRPFDQTVGLPRTNPNLTMDLHPTCGNNTATPAQGWSFCPSLNN